MYPTREDVPGFVDVSDAVNESSELTSRCRKFKRLSGLRFRARGSGEAQAGGRYFKEMKTCENICSETLQELSSTAH
jgi:hypothetical protein